jgi:BirA family biotin operon repressor/biotin-[acetyl-CoA-carboxylase] ligase
MVSEDLSESVLSLLLPRREIRSYPAILSTEAVAMAWARSGAAEGALVVTGYQVSPRGRGGKPLEVDQERCLAFSLILHPTWPIFREGWLYTAATAGLAEVIGSTATIEWPDEVSIGGSLAAAAAVHVEPLENQLWAVVTVLMSNASLPRGGLLARAVAAIEAQYQAEVDAVLRDYLPRCTTIGRQVRARMVPLGPVGPVLEGRAVTCLKDGALVLETVEGRRIAVRPQHLGVLEDLEAVSSRSG